MRYYYYRTFNYRAQYQNTNKYPVDSINDGEFLKLLLDKNKVAEEDIKLTVSTQIIVFRKEKDRREAYFIFRHRYRCHRHDQVYSLFKRP